MNKNALTRHQMMSAGNMATSLTSSIEPIQFLDNVAIQINMVSADGAGTIIVEGSADHQQDAQGNVTNAGTFVDLNLGITIAAGAPDNVLVDVNQASFPYVRVRYVRSSGSGSMDIFVSGKSI